MSDVVLKARISLKMDESPEHARAIALRMVELANTVLSHKVGPDNYEFQVYHNPRVYYKAQGWVTYRTGTREWIFGFAEGFAAMAAGNSFRIVCTGSVIWPDDQYLDDAKQWMPGDEPPEEKNNG